MKKYRAFALLVLAIFLFAGCAKKPVSPTPTVAPTAAATPNAPATLQPPTPTPVSTPAAGDAVLAAYFRQNYDLGYAEAAYADLTHDGQNELIVVELLDESGTPAPVALSSVTDSSDFREGYVRVFSLVNGAAAQIYEREANHAHVGWQQLYLLTDETGAYLFDCNPSVFQGYADYTYTLFSLDAKGGAVVKESGYLSFVVDSAGDGYTYKDAAGKDVSADVAAFEAAAQGYVERAVPLLVYFESLDGTVLYDFLNRELYQHS
ncbi:MAG: hypothetical protein ABFC62_04800 [Clostridiaceae bacterium]|nr:hypothetical protein [Eubacteriales bacterium]